MSEINGPTEQSRMQYGSQYLEQRFQKFPTKKEKKVKIKKSVLRNFIRTAYVRGFYDGQNRLEEMMDHAADQATVSCEEIEESVDSVIEDYVE